MNATEITITFKVRRYWLVKALLKLIELSSCVMSERAALRLANGALSLLQPGFYLGRKWHPLDMDFKAKVTKAPE